MFLLSGVCSQQGLVRDLFLLLYLQHKTHPQVSASVNISVSKLTSHPAPAADCPFPNTSLCVSFSFTFCPFLSPAAHVFLAASVKLRDKFVEIDLRPVCRHCYEHMPEELKRRLARRERNAKDKKKPAVCV